MRRRLTTLIVSLAVAAAGATALPLVAGGADLAPAMLPPEDVPPGGTADWDDLLPSPITIPDWLEGRVGDEPQPPTVPLDPDWIREEIELVEQGMEDGGIDVGLGSDYVDQLQDLLGALLGEDVTEVDDDGPAPYSPLWCYFRLYVPAGC